MHCPHFCRRFHSRKTEVIVVFSPVNMRITLQKKDLLVLSRLVLYEPDVQQIFWHSIQLNIQSKNSTLISCLSLFHSATCLSSGS